MPSSVQAARQAAGLAEKHVTAQVLDVLRADKWDIVRVNIGTAQLHGTWVRFGGKKGRPDHIAIRPVGSFECLSRAIALVIYIEFKKAKGGKLSPDQLERQREILAAGGCVINVGQAKNAPADIECVRPEEFRSWYMSFKDNAEQVLGVRL